MKDPGTHTTVRPKSKRKRELNYYEYVKKLMLMNTDSYLFSIEEAKDLLRMDRSKFVDKYIKTNLIPITKLEDGRNMIKHSDLKQYLETKQMQYIGD